MRKLIVVLTLGFAACSTTKAALHPPGRPNERAEGLVPLVVQLPEEVRNQYEATAPHYMISTEGKAATAAAKKMFEEGGNIIDAAIAASFAISVERPHSTGLGGGGFFMYREAKTGKVYAVDFRERAPLAATQDMYLDKNGEVIPNLSIDGIKAVGTPGLVAGLYEIHKKFGHLPMPKVLEPAIELADGGFPVYKRLGEALLEKNLVLAQYPDAKKIFLKSDGMPYAEGETLVQKDLAESLRKISKGGRDVFYKGEIAKAIVEESKRLGGLITAEDLAQYKVKWREPVKGSYKGYTIFSMPPPSSGGVHVIELLNILERDKLDTFGPLSKWAVHLTASTLQRVFVDRARYMGDPDFVSVPVEDLLSKDYAKKLREQVGLDRFVPIESVEQAKPALPLPTIKPESRETTHFSIIDDQGNMVASTQTINDFMGSSVVVPGMGIVLNNEMDDFSAKAGASNLFGAIGGDQNAIAPLKTPLSSMSPTLVLKNDEPILAVGAPGGTRIISCVAETILNYLEYHLSLFESVSSVRFHHQWKPNLLEMDKPGLGDSVEAGLKNLGYPLSVNDDAVYCRVMVVAKEDGVLHGMADPRDLGSSAGN